MLSRELSLLFAKRELLGLGLTRGLAILFFSVDKAGLFGGGRSCLGVHLCSKTHFTGVLVSELPNVPTCLAVSLPAFPRCEFLPPDTGVSDLLSVSCTTKCPDLIASV